MSNQSTEPKLGYDFHPGTAARFPGHPQLDVTLWDVPTQRHFDPEQVKFETAGKDQPEPLVVTHPWSGPRNFRVCAGRIYIDDRKHKRVEAFSFGGQLEIEKRPELTICRLKSTAPIFDMIDLCSLSTVFATEAEILMATRRADWDPEHPKSFERHLITAVPLELYACCLTILRKKSSYYREHYDQCYHQLAHFIANEIQYLQETGQWPPIVPPLEEIL
jgi:hypothetical protein